MCLVDGEASSCFTALVGKNELQDEEETSESLQEVVDVCLFGCDWVVFCEFSFHSVMYRVDRILI